MDCGDYVVVTNARNIKVTGRKDEQLMYQKHTMYPGGLKETPYQTMMEKRPNEVCSYLLTVEVSGTMCALPSRSFITRSRGCCPRTNYETGECHDSRCSAGLRG